MLGGGEEYFAPPEEIDVDTITRFANLCARLRRQEKPSKKALDELKAEAEAVGSTMAAKEIVAGAIFRCIAAYSGTKQLCYWYLLDILAKQYPHTFGLLFSQHLLDVGCDAMPWEDQALYLKLQSLVEHWDGVFPADVVDRVYLARKERLWAAKHPVEAVEMRAQEEKKWGEVEKQHQEADGLDYYEQPCLAFLQGRCPWGSGCTQLHPDGLEGTMPAETRLGDWRCPGCGAINRHFRRRCFSCPREKPQYRRNGAVKTAEEVALSTPDPEALAALRQRFGYNPCNEADAVAYWANRFQHEPVATFVENRRAAFLNKIMPAVKASVSHAASSRHPKRGHDDFAAAAAPKAHRGEGRAPLATATAAGSAATPSAATAGPVRARLPEIPDMPAPERVAFVCRRIIDRGTQDQDFAGYLFLLCKALPEAIQDAKWTGSAAPEDSLAIYECAKRVFAAWSTHNAQADANPDSGSARRMHPATPFFADVRRFLGALPLTPAHRTDLQQMCGVVLHE
jgi:hypothetical protein